MQYLLECLRGIKFNFSISNSKNTYPITFYYAEIWKPHVHRAVDECLHIIKRDLDMTLEPTIVPDTILNMQDVKAFEGKKYPHLAKLKTFVRKPEIVIWLAPNVTDPPGVHGVAYVKVLGTQWACGICEWHGNPNWEKDKQGLQRLYENNAYVICHEIGHIFGLDHQEIGCMSVGINSKKVYINSDGNIPTITAGFLLPHDKNILDEILKTKMTPDTSHNNACACHSDVNPYDLPSYL
jgi:hypothetical protein